MLSLILFIFILGAIVAIHEFGHFIFAKLSNIYVYEFSIGMGKKIFGKKRKGGETEFCVRAIPLGGYVMIAGEDVEDNKIPKKRQMCNKGFFARFMVLFAGAFFNFILAFVILLVSSLMYGAIVDSKPYVASFEKGYPAVESGLSKGDLILSLDGVDVKEQNDVLAKLGSNTGESILFRVQKKDGSVEEYSITPIVDSKKLYKFGLRLEGTRKRGLVTSFKYAIGTTVSLFGEMGQMLIDLVTPDENQIGIDDLSGPVGIYTIIDSQAKLGLENLLFLVAYLSINVGIINLLPFPAFDGGRILFLCIEKIFRKPVSKKVENIIHSIGFLLIIGLLIFVTFNDISRLSIWTK